MKAQAAYEELVRRSREESLLTSCFSLLGWDELTYMPHQGAEHRGRQMALLAGLHHDQATDPRVGELLQVVEGSTLVSDPEATAAVNVREWRRSYNRLTRLPRHLVEELARITTLAQQEWEAARHDADFGRFQPWLEKIVALKRQEAAALGYEAVPYDAMLDEYEPGATSQVIAQVLDALRQELVPLAAAVAEARPKSDGAILRREYPVERQWIFGEVVAATVGFDFRRGRLDTTTHPFFSSIGADDCRLTTRFDAHHFSDGFFGILHEVGHGLYEQGLDPEHHGTPLGEAASLAVHESQARLWENTVGRSRPFWEHFGPLARRMFPGALADVAPDDLHRAVNHVACSPIRVGADEVTYDLHILVRFELERALMAGDLKVGDVPGAWNEGYRGYLGITPANDTEGCLQDGHWSAGLIGYFPTYTLGNLFAAQLFDQARAELGDPHEAFARGDFGELLGWLRRKVYCQGHRYPAARLLEHVTGSPPNHQALIRALRRKCGELYGV
jgi:carboxypeptidase Taq